MNTGYLIYQAERTMSPAQQREADIANAHLVASIASAWRALTGPRRSRRRAPRRPAGQPAGCAQLVGCAKPVGCPEPVGCLAGPAAAER